MNAKVASLQRLGSATLQHLGSNATGYATGTPAATGVPPITVTELRAQLRAQQQRNAPATTPPLPRTEVASETWVAESIASAPLGYTLADLIELDALIGRFCEFTYPGQPEKCAELLACRRRMRPAAVAAMLAEFRELAAVTCQAGS